MGQGLDDIRQQQVAKMRMHKLIGCLVLSLLVGCASAGIVPMDKGTSLIAKKSAQVGFGPPIGIKGEAYAEANDFCAKEAKSVETLRLEQTDSGFVRPAAVSLEFRCVAK